MKLNKTIKDIQTKIKQIEAAKIEAAKPFGIQLVTLDIELSREFDRLFKKNRALKKAISDIESSNEFGIDDNGELYTWVRFELEDFKEVGMLNQLDRYLSEGGYHLNAEHDAILNFQGGYIGINADDGDVYFTEQGHTTFIIDSKDYESEAERNALIEAYMAKQGYWPNVVIVTQHGDVYPVNTAKQSKEGAK